MLSIGWDLHDDNEDPGSWIESLAIIDIHGVSTKQNLYYRHAKLQRNLLITNYTRDLLISSIKNFFQRTIKILYYSLYYFLVFLLVESLQMILRISVQT
jgi:hypothetical protein